jgi:hypothetical protein
MNDEDCGAEIWDEIAGLGKKFYVEAVTWWNYTLTHQERMLIVGMTYYDILSHEVEHIDDFIEYLRNNKEDKQNDQ